MNIKPKIRKFAKPTSKAFVSYVGNRKGRTPYIAPYIPSIDYIWSTRINSDTRKLSDNGISKHHADLYFGRGCKLNAVDQEIQVNTTNANVLYSFQNGVLVTEDVSTIDTYTIVSDNIHQNYISTSVAFTDAQIKYLTNNPERFLYREDDVLKSQILTQDEIDNVVAYLPMVETDGYVRDLVNYSEGVNLIQFPLSNWSIYNDEGDSSITEDASGNIVLDYVSADNVYLNILQSVSVTDVSLKVRIVVDSIVGAIKIQDSDTNASFGRITSSGTYEFVSTSNQPNVVIARDNGSVDTNAVISSFEIIELTATYPITNYTDAVRTDAKNLNTGLQTCFWKRDALGVPTGSSFDRLECDGVGYADTGWIPNGNFLLEMIIDTKSKKILRQFGSFGESDKDRFSIDLNSNGHVYTTVSDTGYSLIANYEEIPIFHYYIDIQDTKVIYYINGILIKTNDYTVQLDSNKSFFLGALNKYNGIYSYNVPIRLFKIHTEPQDPLELYNKAVNKGLLL